jgi:hypothetical protein
MDADARRLRRRPRRTSSVFELLGGKLVSMLAQSNEVREVIKKKYAKRITLASGRRMSGDLAMLTTSSALGRSSMYNRRHVSVH